MSVRNEQIGGDLTVTRHAAVGGRLRVKGVSRFGRDVKIEGWLDAPNIKGPWKGLFMSLDDVRAAYPEPEAGWLVLVGQGLPADIYVWEQPPYGQGQWTLYEKDFNNLSISVSLDGLRADMDSLQDAMSELLLRLETLTSADNSDAIDNFNEIVRFLAGISDKETLEGILAGIAGQISAVDKKADGKVDKVTGKGLSTNDYTNEEKAKLRGLPESAELTTQLGKKVDKVDGKGLSTNDYTNEEKKKLNGIAEGANKYEHPATHPASVITEDATHRFMTDAERTKLNGIAEGANKYEHPDKHPASIIEQSDERMFVTKEFLDAAKRVVANGLEVLPVSMPEYYQVPSAPQRPDEGIFLIKGDPYDYFLVNRYGSIYDDADYNRYVNYMGAEVPQARTDKLYMCGSRVYTYDGSGLVAFATVNDRPSGSGSSGDGGSFSGDANEIKTDALHRFVTDAEKKKWNTPELLPLDGLREGRDAMPSYGVWAFPEENGKWTIDGDFSALGLTRADYCDRLGIDQSAYVPKQTALFLCKCYDDSKCRKLYYSDPEDNYAVKPYAQLEDVPSTEKMVPVLPVDSVVNSYDATMLAEIDDVVLSQMSIGGTLKWVVKGNVAKYGTIEDYGTVNTQLSSIQNQTVIDPKAGLLIYDRSGKELYRTVEVDESVAMGGVTVMRYACVDATLERMPRKVSIGIASATSEGQDCSVQCSESFTEQMLKSIRVGDTLTFHEVDGVAKIDCLPNGMRGNILVTNVWDDDDVWTVGFQVWGLDYFNIGEMWWNGTCAVVRTFSLGDF